MSSDPYYSESIFSSLLDQLPILGESLFAEPIQHWCDIKPVNGLPDRADLNPAKMKSVLPSLMITELKDDQSLEIKLVGDSAATFRGYSLKGSNLYDLMDKKTATDLFKLVECIKEQPAAIFMRYVNIHSDESECEDINIGFPLTSENASGGFSHFLTIVQSADTTFLAKHGEVVKTCVRYNDLRFVDLGFGCPALPDFS